MQYFDISNLSFNQIKIFICVAENGSFSDAARKLNYSQSMISKTISGLEHDLGVQLVARVKSQNILTEAGNSLYKDFKSLIKYAEDSVARAHNIQKSTDTTLRIGMIDCVTSRENLALHSAGLGGHGCVFQRPLCGAKRPHVITDFLLLLS